MHNDDTTVTAERKTPDVTQTERPFTTFERVRFLTAHLLGVGERRITSDSHFRDDLGADSLDSIKLQVAVAESFGIEVPDDEMDKIISVGDLVSWIDAKQAA